MDSTIFPGCNYSDGGNKYLGKRWGLKSRIYYNCRRSYQFVQDCSFVKSDRKSQLIVVSGKDFVQNYYLL